MSKSIKDLSIPATINDVLMARIDSLSMVEKEILQAGSVIEREFSYYLLKTVMEKSDKELLAQLSSLVETELIYISTFGVFWSTSIFSILQNAQLPPTLPSKSQ